MSKLKIIHKTSTSLQDWLHTTLHQCLDCTATTSQYTYQVPWTRPHGVDPTRQVPQWLRWAVVLGTSFVKSKHCFCASWTATELTRRWKKMIQTIFCYERKRRNMKKLWSPHKATPYPPPPKPLTNLNPSRSHALLPWLWSGPNLGNSDFNRSVFPGFVASNCRVQSFENHLPVLAPVEHPEHPNSPWSREVLSDCRPWGWRPRQARSPESKRERTECLAVNLRFWSSDLLITFFHIIH